MQELLSIFTGLENTAINPYLLAVLLFVVVFIVLKAIAIIGKKIATKLAKKTKTDVDDLIIDSTYKYASFVILVLALKIAAIPLKFPEAVTTVVNKIFNSLLILILAYLAVIVSMIVVNKWGVALAKKTKSRTNDMLVKLLAKLMKIVFLAFAFIFILDLWGVEVGPLVASLGIIGVALAFGLQSTLGNIFGGMSLILDKAYRQGDIIKLESGEMGTVYAVGLRSTKIKTFNNEILIVPNDKMANSIIENVNLPDPTIRVDILFGVEYGSKVEKVKKVAIDAVKNIKHVMKDPAPNILFTEMADSSLNFKIMFYVEDLEHKWDCHQQAITNIYNQLNKNRIGIPFPTQTVYVKK